MRVLVVGSGGREHAICTAFAASPSVSEIFCANGNAGIGQIAKCVDIRPDQIEALAVFAGERAIDLTFVGGETSLALGIVDEFERRGLCVIGPTKAAARLESSKAFAKDFMNRYASPTAASETADSPEAARAAIESGRFGDAGSTVVVKADGLAAGKGVIIASDREEAIEAIDSLATVAGAEAASRIVIEEFMTGPEVSLLAFCDGTNFVLMPPVRDHKRIGDGDTGPNTGGMGTVADSDLLSAELLREIEQTIVRPTLDGCRSEGFPFRGILFVGLMLTPDGPRVLEYNVRFGDPETQVILPLLESDIVDVCDAMLSGDLGAAGVCWSVERAACVVLASRGYPGTPQKGDIIFGLDLAERHENVKIFHAGTALDAKGHFVTNGGRVLGVTARGATLDEALDRAYLAVNDVSWNGMQFRHDIGR